MGNGVDQIDKGCTYGQISREKIKTTTEKMDEKFADLTVWMRRLEDALKEALKRPGWGVLMIISGLAAACGILATALIAFWK